MILSANGRDFSVPGKNLKVTVTGNLARKSLSGQTASTDTASEGNKAKQVSCALLIEKKNPNDLKQLKEIAEAVNAAGDPEVYTIGDELCNAMQIRQVIFSDTFEAAESDVLRSWDIKFNLKESKSVAEKKEEREYSAQIKGTDSQGREIKPSSNDTLLTQTLTTSAQTIQQ